ncbi:MAG: glutathione S-transferase family protein [Chthoniobacteraceae bacterium]
MPTQPQYPKEQTGDGQFQRQDDAFREWVKRNGSTAFPAVAGRYHLYVSLACPWAHRTVIMRRLKGLEGAIGMTVVDPIRNDEDGWAFRDGDGCSPDPINGFAFLREAYEATQSGYDARVTVPVLWDTETRRIVSNSDDDIMRMFNEEFAEVAEHETNYVPANLRDEIDELNAFIYEAINNGVYRAGFATSQRAYESAVRELFAALNVMEERLTARRYLFGKEQTESDWRLFPTLIRFDAVYHGHFKCNLRRIADYPALSHYLRDLYQHDAIADTVNFNHIKRHYYITHDDINPTGIVPLGPILDLDAPHLRESL